MWATICKLPPTEDVQIGSFFKGGSCLLEVTMLTHQVHIQIVQIDLCTFTWKSSWENLFKDQSNFLWG